MSKVLKLMGIISEAAASSPSCTSAVVVDEAAEAGGGEESVLAAGPAAVSAPKLEESALMASQDGTSAPAQHKQLSTWFSIHFELKTELLIQMQFFVLSADLNVKIVALSLFPLISSLYNSPQP